MSRDEIFKCLHEAQPELRRRGVSSLAVFGSVALGDFSPESDLDVLVEFDRPVGLFDFMRLKFYLEQATGCRVDLVTTEALRPAFRERILGEAVYVR
jgi:hypothetical protein